LLSDAEFGQSGHGCGTYNRVLKYNAVVDVADVLRRLCSPGTFDTKQVKNTNGQLRKLAVLDELAQVSQSLLLSFRHELDQIENALDNAALEVVATLVAQNA
jgi:cell division FtsZ-interacting protein ZapD